MKQLFLTVLILFSFFCPSTAGTAYRVEVLQVGRFDSYDQVYGSILKGFERHGLVTGKDLRINRTIIDTLAAGEVYNWENLRLLMKIKITAGEIAEKKPDLVITIGTPATRYARPKIVKAGIPLVFTCVEVPEAVGCRSNSQAGQGFTGVATYIDPGEVLRIAGEGLKDLKKIGIIYSDDNEATAYTDDAMARAKSMGIEVVTRQVNLWDSITPAAENLISEGIDAFFIPVDRYYRVKGCENSRSLATLSFIRKVPCISSTATDVKGPLISINHDYTAIGLLTADQSSRILLEDLNPEAIPIGKQAGFTISVDTDASEKLGIALPLQLLKMARGR